MKKRYLFLIILAMFTFGCEHKMSEKEIAEEKEKIINYVKSNMTSSWNYALDKVSVDDEFNTTIKVYNVLDLSDCVLETKEDFATLKKNLNADSRLKKVNMYCEYGTEKIGHVESDNIHELNIENYNSEIKLFDSSNQLVIINNEFFGNEEKQFIAKCQKYAYKDIFRHSEQYISKYAWFKGEVIQVIDNNEFFEVRMNVTKGEYGYNDTVFASIPKNYFSGRILEGDIITVYGRLKDLVSYQSIFGQEITIPSINVRYAKLN